MSRPPAGWTLWIRDPGSAFGAMAARPIAVGIVLGMGLAVRIAAAGQARFDSDESSFWEAALRIAEGESFPLVGHPITGSPAGHPGALFYYLMALPQLFTSDPLAGSVFVALLNLAGIALVFLALRDGWGDRPAFLFLLLAVASPWTVVYGDRIWPSNMVLPLCGVVLFCTMRTVRRERSRAVGPLLLVLTAGVQLHLSTLHLWMLVLVVWLVFRPRLNLPWLFAGLFVGALTYVPYLVHELRTDFSNTRLILQHAAGGARSWSALAGLYLHFFGFATTDVSYLFSHGYWYWFDHLEFWKGGGASRTLEFYAGIGPAGLLGAYQLMGWAFVGLGSVFAAVRWAVRPGRWARLRDAPLAWAFLSAIASIAVLYAVSRKAGYAHYVNMLLPLAFLPAVALLSSLSRVPVAGHLAALYVLAAPIVGALVLGGYYRLDSRMSIPQQKRVVAFILERIGGARPFELRFTWREGRPDSYARLARGHFKAEWPMRRGARDVFTVMVRPAQAPPGALAALELDTLQVVHTRR